MTSPAPRTEGERAIAEFGDGVESILASDTREGTRATSVASTHPERLHRKLSPFHTLLLTLSCLSPVLSVYGLGSNIVQHTGTGAAVLFLIGIGAAIVWGAVYAELGSAYPYAGGDYVGVGSVLGPAVGFVCLALWAVSIMPQNAYLATMIATYVRQLAPAAPPTIIAIGSLALATGIALLAARTSALVTGAFLAIEMLAILVLLIAGFWHPAGSFSTLLHHPVIPDASGYWMPVAFSAMAVGAVNAAFDTVGGNQAIAFGEELVDPHRKMGPVILVACLVGAITIALPVIGVVWHARTDAAIFGSAAPFSAFITSVAGPKVGLALSAAVALAMFNALIASLMFSARLVFSFARDGIFPVRLNAALARVHRPSGAPRVATLAIGLVTAPCCVLSQYVLLVFISGLVVYSLGLVSLAVLIGRLRGLTGGPGFWRSPLFPLAPILGLALAMTFSIADWTDRDAGRPSLLILGGLLLLALAWHHFVLRRRSGGWAPRVERVRPVS